MKTLFYVFGDKIDFYFHYWKFAMKCDEKGHGEHILN